MKAKCDRCDRDATVTEVLVKGGQKIERHLCESCARDAGVSVAPGTSLDKLMASFVMQHQQAATAGGAQATTPRTVANACRACGLAFAEFRQKGLLGCPECYKAFENQLGPLVERAHQGASFHCGKAPVRGAADEVITQRLSALRKQLNEAVAAEQYERAAAIRDELARADVRPPSSTPRSDATQAHTKKGSDS
ncbi:MAG: UvrB/UvrC motif-containing protein [Phycisphaerales bacterium]